MNDKFDKIINVTKSALPPYEEYCELIKDIWNSAWITNMGPLHQAFETRLKEFLMVKNATLFVNGHLALDAALKLNNLKGEVITTPFTFASTVHAITLNGLTPVFCDIKRTDYTIDEDKIEDLITENTSAILPVHVYGNPCNVYKIEEIAGKYGLKVIYDAAHVFGVKINGEPIGNFGDISMFSMHATKVFHSIEGGVLTYKNDGISARLNNIKNFGIKNAESVVEVGFNAKMNEFQAAMGILNLKYIEKNNEKRRLLTERYRLRLMNIAGIKLQEVQQNITCNYSYFPVLVDKKQFGLDRNELHEKLLCYNIATRKYFYPLASDYECYK
jgi:dTDP-4-amino-4,6-dideoxygalactose transaminase